MNSSTVKLGFVGCGTHSTNNLYLTIAYTRGRLEAVCDLDESLARRNATLFGIPNVFTSVGAMLSECKLDGVLVVGPAAAHHEVGMQVLARGIPLFTEKPPAPTLAAARQLVELAREKGTFIMTGFMKRHGMAYRKAREMITAGQFVPAALRINYSHWGMGDLRGMLLGMSSHAIDLAISFLGSAISVTSMVYRSPQKQISLALTLRFESGRWAQLMLDSSQPRIQERLEISGTADGANALIVVDNVQHMEFHKQISNGVDVLKDELWQITPEVYLQDVNVWRPDYAIPNMGQSRLFFQGFVGEMREFVDAIIEGRQPYPGTDDVLKAMRVIEAVANNPDGTTAL